MRSGRAALLLLLSGSLASAACAALLTPDDARYGSAEADGAVASPEGAADDRVDPGSDAGDAGDAAGPCTSKCTPEEIGRAPEVDGGGAYLPPFAEVTNSVAVDDNYVYFTTWPVIPGNSYSGSWWGGKVYFLSKSSPTTPATVLDETNRMAMQADIAAHDGGPRVGGDGPPPYYVSAMPGPIVALGGRAYWGTWYDPGGLRSVAVGAERTEHLQCTPCGFFRMASEGNRIYATQYDRGILSLAPTADGGVVTQIVANATLPDGGKSNPELRGVAVHNGRVYWSTKQALRSSLPDGSGVTTHYEIDLGSAAGQAALFDSIVVDNKYVYFADRQTQGGMVARVDLGVSAGPEVLGANLGDTRTILLDGNTLYAVGTSKGTIYSFDLTQKPVVTNRFVQDLQHPHDIALDSTYLYIAGGDDAKIYRVPKL